MKKLLIMSVAIATLMVSCKGGGSTEVKTYADSVSRAAGILMGANFKTNFADDNLNTAVIDAAIKEVLKVEDLKDIQSELEAAQALIMNHMQTVVPQRKIAASEKYISEIEKKSEVKKTESGLLYEITEAGDATMMPTPTDTVVVNYKGTLSNGKQFDSSYDRGEPATFPLNQVIPGWTEGLQLVGKGGKIKLYIKSELAYGPRGELANEALTFEVEVLDVKKAQ